MPGSGKTTVGKLLAEKLRLKFVDLDLIIEKESKKKIAEIFIDSGELFFRNLETSALDLMINNKEKHIIACGGGTPCFNDNLIKMKANGMVVFIETPVDQLLSRVSQNDNRPMLTGVSKIDKLKSLYDARIGFYIQSHIRLINETGNPEHTVSKLAAILKSKS